MIAYRDDRPATVTSGGKMLVEFKGDTAEVSEEVGGILEQAGYRVERNENDANRASESADTADVGRGRGISARNSKKRD